MVARLTGISTYSNLMGEYPWPGGGKRFECTRRPSVDRWDWKIPDCWRNKGSYKRICYPRGGKFFLCVCVLCWMGGILWLLLHSTSKLYLLYESIYVLYIQPSKRLANLLFTLIYNTIFLYNIYYIILGYYCLTFHKYCVKRNIVPVLDEYLS